MNRSEVWWVSFDPSIGGEIQKTRPAAIVSNNSANDVLNRVVVVPLSSKIEKIYLAEALVTVNGERRKAMADQIMTVSKQRFRSRLGTLSGSDMLAVENAILLHLGIRR